MHKLYSRVKLVTDRFRDAGATEGMLGYVILLHPDGRYEVEFSDTEGTTIAEIVADNKDLVAAPEVLSP